MEVFVQPGQARPAHGKQAAFVPEARLRTYNTVPLPPCQYPADVAYTTSRTRLACLTTRSVCCCVALGLHSSCKVASCHALRDATGADAASGSLRSR